jgi:apolipoprotein N-acyltransferase
VQFADVGGVAGLTVALLLANEALSLAWARRREARRRWLAPLLAALALPALLAGYGAVRLAHLQQLPAEERLRVGLVQANIVDYERLRREHGAHAVVRQVLDTHFALSRQAVGEHAADALLWSETVYPTTFAQPRSEAGADFDRELLAFVRQLRVPLVLGTYERDDAGEYNVAAFIAPDDGLLGSYRKTHLFPFTERLPALLDHAWVRARLPWAGAWRAGDGARVLPLRLADGREVPAGTLICLDDVHPGVAREAARQGARVLLGMSNDSWFTAWPQGARLHLAVASFRSIETRLPQLRVTANGISAVVDADGRIVARTGMDQATVLIGEVALRTPPRTLAVAWGSWVGAAGLALLLGLWLPAAMAWLRARLPSRRQRTAQATTARSLDEGVDVLLPSRALRGMAALLRVVAGLGLAWVAALLVFGDGDPAHTLPRLRLFAAVCIAPALAAWAILRAQSGRLRRVGDAVWLERAGHAPHVVPSPICATAWTLPLPAAGLSLRGGDGSPAEVIADDPPALLRALETGGVRVAGVAGGPWARLLAARAWRARGLLDRAWLKFGLYPLLPALVAFRLHQHIAYGGTFGEAYSFGIQAWLLGLAVWWGKWAMGMTIFAGALRVLAEVVAFALALMRTRDAARDRRMLEWALRLAYYLGVPLWLALRLLG